MKSGRWTMALVLLLALGALAQFNEPAPADTVRQDTLASWPDTSVSIADTLIPPVHASWPVAWLYPLGIAAVTCLGFVLLYSIRSR